MGNKGAVIPVIPTTRRRLSQEEIAERRQKGLCFGCNEPYIRDHRCSRRQIFSLWVNSVGDEDESRQPIGEKDEDVQVTLHAINGEDGVEGAKTMRVEGQYKGKTLQILIDSGSTHNFIDMGVVKGLGISTVSIKPVSVTVADGRSIKSSRSLQCFEWEMQGQTFTANFFIIPLAGCEMVLGVQWLANLGDITWNFQSAHMRFQRAGRLITLRGGDQKQERKLWKVVQGKAISRSILQQMTAICIQPSVAD
ncbi:hypothetical protein MLD38_039466 [Melastoma candidum]|nr:hypothetical protein MLD38_039466 [Melastoma candidum]